MNNKKVNQPSCQTGSNPIINSYAAVNTTTQASATNNTMGIKKNSQTIIGVFESRSSAEKAVETLRQQGFSNEEINIISKKQSQDDDTELVDDDIMDGTLTGGTIGGIGGLLLGAGALMIPGVGPILAVGPIAAAVGGAIAGGITGGLIDWGIPSEDSKRYEQEVVHGSILAIIRTDAMKTDSVAQILRQNGAKEVKSHTK